MRVIFRDIDPISEGKKRIIRQILERDKDNFWVVEFNSHGYLDNFFIEFYKGRECDFNVNDGCLGADYYATIECDIRELNPFELAEHYVPIEGSEDCEIHILGNYKTLGMAVSMMMRKGNSTKDGRKPIKIFL